jgi:Domain of unknown function (DU1801)
LGSAFRKNAPPNSVIFAIIAFRHKDKIAYYRSSELSVKKTSKSISTESPAKQLATFIAKFDPAVAKQIRSCRSALRKRFPTAIELVYDNYNFLAIGFCATDRASSCIVSLASQAKGVSLCFYYGATLPDPDNLLHGGGNQVRFLHLESAKTLTSPKVELLLRAAVAQSKSPLPVSTKGYTIIKSISAKQRPRRASVK